MNNHANEAYLLITFPFIKTSDGRTIPSLDIDLSDKLICSEIIVI